MGTRVGVPLYRTGKPACKGRLDSEKNMCEGRFRSNILVRVALVLMLIIAISVTGCASGSQGADGSSSDLGSGNGLSGDGLPGVGNGSPQVEVLDFEEYDPEPFYALCDELSDAASGTDSERVIELYDQIYEELERIEDMDTALYHAFCANVADEELSDLVEACDELSDECFVVAQAAVADACNGPCGPALEEHVGSDAFEELAAYEPVGDRELELANREAELVNDYYAAIDRAWEEDLSDEELNEIVGPIFIELVDVRTEYAQLYGYENYADYADEQTYWRDYGADDLAGTYEAVRSIAPRYYDLYFNTDAIDALYYDGPSMETDEILEYVTQYADQIDPTVVDALALLTEDNLYDIGAGSGRMEGGYTDTFLIEQKPFIYIDLDGYSDLQTMTHELGHFVDYCQHPTPNILAYGFGCNMDIAEIQSNGLQVLYMRFYEDIYGDAGLARMAANFNLMELLGCVVDGCVFDEFQREVYENPDMTLEEVNELYRSIAEEYGDPSTGPDDYWWQYVSHNFDAPMYYMSYAASGIVALQIWDQSQSNYDHACTTWRAIIDAGNYDYGYQELLGELGLSGITDPDAVTAICTNVLDCVEGNLEQEQELENAA